MIDKNTFFTTEQIGSFAVRKERRQMLADVVRRMAEKDIMEVFTSTSGCESTSVGITANTFTTQDVTLEGLHKLYMELEERFGKPRKTVIVGDDAKIEKLRQMCIDINTSGPAKKLVLPDGVCMMLGGIPVVEIDPDLLFEECAALRKRYGKDVKIILLHEVDGEGYAIDLSQFNDFSWPSADSFENKKERRLFGMQNKPMPGSQCTA